MDIESFEKHLFLSSVQLVELSDELIPKGFASGTLIDYNGMRILLTVSHATGNQGNWAIQQKFTPKKNTQAYALGAMNFIAEVSLTDLSFKDIDFSYVAVPADLVAYRQEITTIDKIDREQKIIIHKTTLEDTPLSGETFGFCGMVKPTHEHHYGKLCVGGDIMIYTGLTYLRSEGSYEVFKLPFKHPGHDFFRGCSGAPVISSSGKIVGLVCKGFEESDELYALSLKRQKLVIDIYTGAI